MFGTELSSWIGNSLTCSKNILSRTFEAIYAVRAFMPGLLFMVPELDRRCWWVAVPSYSSARVGNTPCLQAVAGGYVTRNQLNQWGLKKCAGHSVYTCLGGRWAIPTMLFLYSVFFLWTATIHTPPGRSLLSFLLPSILAVIFGFRPSDLLLRRLLIFVCMLDTFSRLSFGREKLTGPTLGIYM